MKSKLHFGILVLLLAFLATYLEQNSVPNQQIVIQFSDKEITVEDTDTAIKSIRNQLQSIGVSQIQIGQNEAGQLRITYYSESDVEHIQNVLVKTEDFNLAYDTQQNPSNHFPEHKKIKNYELNISEIKTSSKVNWDFEGTQIVEINQKTDRFSYSKTNSFGHQTLELHTNNSIRVAVLVSNTIAIALGTNSYVIPEVRAGPCV